MTYEQTFLTENDHFGIVDPNLIPSLDEVDARVNPIRNAPCFVQNAAIPPPVTTLLPYDLTRGGTNYLYHGHTDVKQLALYVQDSITYTTGPSTSAFAEISTTASPSPARPASARCRVQHQAH